MVQSVRKVPPHYCKKGSFSRKGMTMENHPFEDVQYLLLKKKNLTRLKKDNFHYTMLVFGVVLLEEILHLGCIKPCKWDEGMNYQVVSRTSSNPQGFSLQTYQLILQVIPPRLSTLEPHRPFTFHLLIQLGFTNHIVVGLPNTFFYSKGFIIIWNWTTTF